MKSIAPIVFRGKYFSIANFFSSDNPNSDSILINKSIITRGLFNLNQLQQEFDINFQNNTNISAKLHKIKSLLKINYQYLELNFDHFRYSDGDSEAIVYKYNFDELLNKLNKWGIKKKLDKSELINVQNALKHFPSSPQNDFEVQIIINYLSQILSKFNFSNLDENSVLIISGEMLWSGFIGIDLLINLFKTSIQKNIYLLFDVRAVWQLLLSFEQSKALFGLNKKYMLPEVYSLKYKSNSNTIRINIDSENKTFMLVKKINLFNLGHGANFWESTYLPQYLLVENLLDKSDKKEFEHFGVDLGLGDTIEFVPQTQYSLHEYTKKISFYIDNSQKCTRKIGEWINENETIGSYKKDIYESIFTSQKSKIIVFDGQIVRKGEVIATDLHKKNITAEIAGKIDLSNIKNGQIKIVSDKNDEEIKSPLSGELVSFNKSQGFIINSQFKSILLGAHIGGTFWGKLSDDKNSNDTIIKFLTLKDFIQDYNSQSLHKYILNRIRGVIIEYAFQEEIDKFLKLSTPPFGIGFLSVDADPFQESKLKMVKEMLGKNIFVENTNLLINVSNEFDMGRDVSKEQMDIEYRCDFKVGEVVRFSSFLTNKLYGKIIKLPSPKNQSYLVDNGDRIFEINLNNLVRIQYE